MDSVIVTLAAQQDESFDSAFQESERTVNDFSGSVDKSGTSMKDAALAGVAIGAAIEAVSLVVDACKMAFEFLVTSFKEWITAASEAEVAETKLRAILKATGEVAGFSGDQLVKMSGDLMQFTRFSDDAVQSAQSILLTFKTIRGDVFADAIKSAANLAEVMGTDITGATRMLGRALEDPERGMMALRRAGVIFTASQKEVVAQMVATGDKVGAQRYILAELEKRVGGVAAAMGGTFAGKIEIAKNRLGELAEAFGRSLLPAIDLVLPLLPLIETAVMSLEPIFSAAVKWVLTWAESWRTTIYDVVSTVVGVLLGMEAAAETILSKWSELWDLASTTLAYQAVKMYNTISYYFTDVIPGVLKWFAENWSVVLTDVSKFHNTVLANMGKNILSFVQAVRDALSGKLFKLEFTALTDGFEATTKRLPQIAERIEGELEKGLRKRTETLGADIGEDFARRFERNQKFVAGLFKKPEGEKEIDMKSTPKELTDEEKESTKKKAKEKKAKEKKEKDDSSTGDIVGLEDLAKQIEQGAAKAEKEKKVEEAIKEGNAQALEGFEGLKTAMNNITAVIGHVAKAVVDPATAVVDADAKQAERDARIEANLKSASGFLGLIAGNVKELSKEGIPAVYGE